MSDPESLPPLQAAMRAKDYPTDERPATASLKAILQKKISESGSIPFADFMALALYEPGLGYYARESRQVGRGGDFFTSVSVGPLFGELLARRFLSEWHESGTPARWRIIECGAHDGTLACDILSSLARLDPRAFAAVEYVIAEPLANLQAAQRLALDPFSNKIRLLSTLDEVFADPLTGIAFGNELLDALPFHVVEWRDGVWYECRVAMTVEQKFLWENHHAIIEPARLAVLAGLGNDFPEGYRTEIRTNFINLLEPLIRSLSSGLLLWLDYGFARPEYYHPDRSTGTLRTFSKHRAAENPLTAPGEIDITAHVDFTSVAEAALTLGCYPTTFRSQGSWLTSQARDWLLAQEGNSDPSSFRQFQTLTHPAQLGASFHVLEISWNQGPRQLSANDLHRLALRACPQPVTQ